MDIFLVYILHSQKIDRYYVGQTRDIEQRIEQHNNRFYPDSFTKQADDWALKHIIPCRTIHQAIQIEQHIKKNRSRKYIENLIQYPSISIRLKERYGEHGNQ